MDTLICLILLLRLHQVNDEVPPDMSTVFGSLWMPPHGLLILLKRKNFFLDVLRICNLHITHCTVGWINVKKVQNFFQTWNFLRIFFDIFVNLGDYLGLFVLNVKKSKTCNILTIFLLFSWILGTILDFWGLFRTF
jgi:hypothetical protein